LGNGNDRDVASALLRRHGCRSDAMDEGSGEEPDRVEVHPDGIRDVPEGFVVAATRMGRALFPGLALDRDAARRTLRGHGTAGAPGRGHPSVLPAASGGTEGLNGAESR